MPAHFIRAFIFILAVALIGSSAHAQQETTVERQYVTPGQAMEMSHSNFVIHRGEGVSDRRLRFVHEMIETRIGVPPIILDGNPVRESVSVYILGKSFRDEDGNVRQFSLPEMGIFSAYIEHLLDNDLSVIQHFSGASSSSLESIVD